MITKKSKKFEVNFKINQEWYCYSVQGNKLTNGDNDLTL